MASSIHGLGRFPRRRKWQPTPVLLPGKPHGQRSLAGCSPWDRKELDTTENTHTHTHTHTHTRLNQGEQSMSRNWGPQDQARAVGRKTKPGFEPPFWFGLCEDEDRAGL